MVLVAIGEALRRMGWSRRTSRRLVHAGVGVFVAFTPDIFAAPPAVYLLAAGFVIVNAWTLRRGWLQGIHADGDKSWGTVIFPLALIPALYFCWSLQPDRQFALRVAFLILAFADPVAAWAGGRFGKTPLLSREGGQKSIAGSAAFAAVALVTSLAALGVLQDAGAIDWSWTETLVASISVSVLTALAEALGRRGWDNFFIVMVALCTLVVFDEQPAVRVWMIGAVGAGALFGIAAWRVGALDRAGALAAALLAVTLVVGGWDWGLPGVVFFVLSSGLSWVGKQRKRSIQQQYEKSQAARDAAQVYANGGAAWGLLVIYLMAPWSGLYWGFLGAFATAAADTWATELGALSRSQPRSLRTGRKVPRGTSGAVSWMGSLAALAGAVSVVGSAALVAEFEAGLHVAVPALIGCGWLGAFVDSLAGATVQAQYFDAATGALREKRSTEEDPSRGWSGITNDRVNWIGTSSGALMAMAAYFVLSG